MASTEPAFATVRFSTKDLSPPARMPFVGEAMRRVGLDAQPLPGEPFRLDAVQRALPGLNVVKVVNSGMRVGRTRALLADGDDRLALAIPVKGAEIFSQLGREVTIADREAVLLSNADAFQAVCPAGKRFLGLWLPRIALAALVPDFEDRFARPIPRGNSALRLLTCYLNRLCDDDTPAAPARRGQAAVHVCDLIALAIGAGRDAAALARGRGLRAARLSAIKFDIATHFGNGRLSVGAVAARQQVTPRYVQMLFEGEGTTFSRYVIDQRLACAHRMLSEPRRAGPTIAAIAFEVGFGDLSYFNRAFRRAYGASPSDVRDAAREGGWP